jgi:hypothetical protein
MPPGKGWCPPIADLQREDPEPEIEHPPVDRIAGRESHALDRGEPVGEPDRESGENDVEADDERHCNRDRKTGSNGTPFPPECEAARKSPSLDIGALLPRAGRTSIGRLVLPISVRADPVVNASIWP